VIRHVNFPIAWSNSTESPASTWLTPAGLPYLILARARIGQRARTDGGAHHAKHGETGDASEDSSACRDAAWRLAVALELLVWDRRRVAGIDGVAPLSFHQ